MSSRSLDPVIAKIDNSDSNQNLYRSFSQEDRITMQATPLSNNITGSVKGLVSNFTPRQFQSFDMGRDTHATLAQEQECLNKCMSQCVPHVNVLGDPTPQCHAICKEICVNDTTKDFI